MRAGAYLVSGLIGGLLGAVIWIAVAYFTGYDMAWIAWPVGLIAGVGVRVSAKEAHGWHVGLVGALMAAVAIGAGKAGMVYLAIETPDDMPVALVADEIIQERLDAGQPINWADKSYVVAADSLAAEYPVDVWDEAVIRWASMTPSQQGPYDMTVTEQIGAVFAAAFIASFSLFDFLWLGLGVMTAYRAGAGIDFGDAPRASSPVHISVPAPHISNRRTRKVDLEDDGPENNFFRRMRPPEDDDLPSLGGARPSGEAV